MEDEIRRLRTEAQRLAHGKPRSQVRYPSRFRRAAVALARRRLGQGGGVARFAREVGVSEPTLAKWLRPMAAPVLRRVVLTSTPSSAPAPGGRPVLITRNGVRVEGLDRETLVALLQTLG
jgi:transposase-like protein